jgi:cob(I)alamin adenosyltransferase
MAIRIDRVFTRTGDDGETSLALGDRVGKDSQRVEAYGTVDELNCAIGAAREELRSLPAGSEALRDELDPLLVRIQRSLFDLGAYLATAPDRYQEGMPAPRAEDIRLLEAEIERWGKELPPLGSFVLPGGSRLAASLHLSRAVCRRAEREAVRLHRAESLSKPAIPYLNRLSDWLFVAARHASKALGAPETLWKE